MRPIVPLVVALLLAACGPDDAPEPVPDPVTPSAAPAGEAADAPDTRYLGLVHPPMPADVVKRGGALVVPPGGDAAQARFAFEDVSVGGTRMLWLSTLERRTPEGEAVWRVVDAVAVAGVGENERFFVSGCRTPDDVVAAVAVEGEDAVLTDVRRAWRVERAAERLVPADAGVVTCENQALLAP